MPQSLACGSIESKNIAFDVSRESEPSGRCEYPRCRRTYAKRMRPANLARLIIDCFQHPTTPQTVVGAGPTISAIRRLGEVNAVTGVGRNDEQPVVRIEAGSAKIGKPVLVGCDQAPVGGRLFVRVGNGAALLVYPS